MSKTCELLDRVKARYSLPSDYAVAKKLGISPSAMYKYRHHNGSLDDSIALRVAELLGVEPLPVLASVHFDRAEKTHNESLKNFWQQYAA